MKSLKIGVIAALTATISFSSLVAFRSVSGTETTADLPVDKVLYEKFLHSFPKVTFPYSIQFERPKTEADVENLYGWSSTGEKDYGVQLGYEFSKFIPALERGYMSRMGPDDFYSDAMLASNDKFSAVIYKRRPNYQSHVTSYVLATFDKNGKMISQRTVGSCYADYFEEPTISGDLKINIAHFKANYIDDAAKTIQYNLEKSEQLHIDDKGEIIAATDAATIQTQQKSDLKTTIKTDLWSN